MDWSPHFWTNAVGSFPHTNTVELCQKLAACLDVPVWPQLSRRSFHENMYAQYSTALPSLMVDETNEKISFDTTGDLSGPMEVFYTHYLEEDLDYFSLQPDYAAGFFALLDALDQTPGEWVKGQVTGPISFGLTVVDQDLRSSLYNEMLADAIVKNSAMNGRWQVRQLKSKRPNVIMVVDEPYMASFGSAFISLDRPQVVSMMNEVFEAIHQEGGLAGVHCCANTDWSVLLETTVDILNLDAYGYMENLALYPAELKAFLERGGRVSWGCVANTQDAYKETPESLAERFFKGIDVIIQKGEARGVEIPRKVLAASSLVTPSCGLGPVTVEVADYVLDLLVNTGKVLREIMA
jgi:hypothetical protein